MFISMKLFGRHLWTCGHLWSIQWALSLGIQHVPRWVVCILSCLPCWAANGWAAWSRKEWEPLRGDGKDKSWNQERQGSLSAGVRLSQGPWWWLAVPWHQKDKNGNPLPVWLSCSVLLKFGCTSEHPRTLFNCRFQFSDLGAQRVRLSIQLPSNAPDPWETTGESIQEARYLLTFWRAQLPLASVSQSIAWVSDYLTIHSYVAYFEQFILADWCILRQNF